MLGYIEFDGQDGALRLAQETRLGGTFLVLNMGRSVQGLFSRRRAARAAEKMRERGVRRAVFPVDFPHTAVFMRRGILPVDPLPLHCTLCARFVQRRLEKLGVSEQRAVVAVSGDYMSAELERTVCELVRSYRYVLLSVRSGGEELALQLRRQCGAALLVGASKDQLERADALVLFAPRPDLRQENPVLCTLYHGGGERGRIALHLSAEMERQTAPNCSVEQLAAALYSMGLLTGEQLIREISC